MKPRIIAVGVSIGMLCAGTASIILAPPAPRLIYNTSESAPKGWYAIDQHGVIKRDAKVAAFAPDEARNLADERGYLPRHIPLVKTIWATSGDEICSENGVIRAPQRPDLYAFHHDSSGRAMPAWQGCIILKNDGVFLVSIDVQTSFDSRYFGPVSSENILGTARFLGTTGEILQHPVQTVGRARGER